MKKVLEKEIKIILSDLGVENPRVDFDIPTHIHLGDYFTNTAMTYAKQLGKKPIDLAEEIALRLTQGNLQKQIKVKAVVPGFINFFFNESYFSDVVKNIISEKNSYGKNDSLNGQKIIIEYTDPNPFKEFHIGHLMSNSIGEAISKIIEIQGAEVKRLSYGGDVGLHVAKTIWAIQKKDVLPDQITTNILGSMYVIGNNSYEEDEQAKKEIDELNKIIFDKSDSKVNELYEQGRKVSIKHFQEMFIKLGTNFDKLFWESEMVEEGLKAVEEGLSKNILEKSAGAIVFKGEKYGLHTRVFVNSKGIPTYEAKELGLSVEKIKIFDFDESIIITGNEQNDYFKVLFQVMDLLRPEVAHRTVHIGHGMLRFTSGKMSSRMGNVITAETLISEVQQKILGKMKDREMGEQAKQNVSEIIAIGALKYSILKQTTEKDIIFDIEKSVSFEGDSGPYLQYATVRANSLLKKAFGVVKISEKIPDDWETTNLERLLERFPNIIEKTGKEYAPHYIATYLIDLAGEFNSFYASHKIIDEADSTSPYRLALTQAFVYVMTTGLNLLGVKVPEQM
ncbi:MAG: arginine--tRNA ligase [Candidatus Zambryskibacteria bacterium]|nr:arginine--tRNA ligase [Candidatus Zambryskibacteria bacterium]